MTIAETHIPTTSPADVLTVARARRLTRTGEARRIRVAAGVSSREIAEGLGLSAGAVERWERGESVPRSDHALAYIRLLDALAAQAA